MNDTTIQVDAHARHGSRDPLMRSAAPASSARRAGLVVDDIARHWLGWTLVPPPRAIELAAWSPDPFDAFCHRCGDSVANGEYTRDGCATCRPGAELQGGIGDEVHRLATFTGVTLDWVHAIKYQRWEAMGEHLGRVLGRRLVQAGQVDADRAVVVPMPMPWARRLHRGIDHTLVIAGGVAAELRAPIARVLRKAMQPPQVRLTPGERRRAGRRGLSIRSRLPLAGPPHRGWSLRGLHVVLVDDVRTTGATLLAASRLLRRLEPERIICAVLAVSDNTARQIRAGRA